MLSTSHRTAGVFDDREARALERVYALASREAERQIPFDDDARRRLANILIYTYRSKARDAALTDDEVEMELVQECLHKFYPLHLAISRVLRRRHHL